MMAPYSGVEPLTRKPIDHMDEFRRQPSLTVRIAFPPVPRSPKALPGTRLLALIVNGDKGLVKRPGDGPPGAGSGPGHGLDGAVDPVSPGDV
jgi:hypothetical protein